MHKSVKDIIIDNCLTLISDMFACGTFENREDLELQHEDIIYYINEHEPHDDNNLRIILEFWNVIDDIKILLEDNAVKMTPKIEKMLQRLENKCNEKYEDEEDD